MTDASYRPGSSYDQVHNYKVLALLFPFKQLQGFRDDCAQPVRLSWIIDHQAYPKQMDHSEYLYGFLRNTSPSIVSY